MNVAILKWPIIILLIVGVLWLLSSAGTNWLHKRLLEAEPSESNEDHLTTLASFLAKTMRYEKAYEVSRDTLEKYPYPDGKLSLINMYRMGRMAEKLGRPRETVARWSVVRDILRRNPKLGEELDLIDADQIQHKIDHVNEYYEIGTVGG